MVINEELQKEIEKYCKANDIEDVDGLINAMLNRGFTIEKFGEHPSGPSKTKIKEVEKIVEVEVEKIVEVVKEVEVEKIVKVSDNEKSDELLKEINDLKETNKKQTQVIMSLNKDIDILNEEFDAKLEEINKMIAPPDDDDIYGDKKGTWGSNLLDILKPNGRNKRDNGN